MKLSRNCFVFAGVATLLTMAGCQDGGTVQATNLGSKLVHINIEGSSRVVSLGQNGTAFIDSDTPFKMGDAAVRINQRVEVANTGEQIIRVNYTGDEGQVRTMLLGENGTGYFDKEDSLKIGDVELRVVHD